MIIAIEHVGIAAKDPAALTEWYNKHLNMKEIRNNGKGTYFLEAPGGFVIEIYPAKQVGETGFDNYTSGMRHLALKVDDFDSEYKRLTDEGVEMAAKPVITDDIKLVLFKDCEGNLCHLTERRTNL